jgi:hypothetical protein
MAYQRKANRERGIRASLGRGLMTDAHTFCAVVNFICFLGFVATILVITARAPNGGHGSKRRHFAAAFAT